MSVSDVFLARDCVRAIRAAMIDSKHWDERAIDFIVEKNAPDDNRRQ